MAKRKFQVQSFGHGFLDLHKPVSIHIDLESAKKACLRYSKSPVAAQVTLRIVDILDGDVWCLIGGSFVKDLMSFGKF